MKAFGRENPICALARTSLRQGFQGLEVALLNETRQVLDSQDVCWVR
jgi:hypothetical protein